MTTDPPAAPPTLPAPARWLLMALAWVCVALGVVGILVPVVPTVPFLLVAAWAASRSSPRLHRRLYTDPRFGRLLLEWDRHRVVPRLAKWAAAGMMALSLGFLLATIPAGWIYAVPAVAAAMLLVLAWLWRRPERPPASDG
ncbi:MAG: hypothetical protein JWP22_794 [Ramlibacter sp.]|jgi:uncharacterized membrane protein YbaN (DUF454 family)|nr:hypothetical protein [Ramlibacter sp.]MDB5912119.1 hypothetical protein [Ramlibacter sp.]